MNINTKHRTFVTRTQIYCRKRNSECHKLVYCFESHSIKNLSFFIILSLLSFVKRSAARPFVCLFGRSNQSDHSFILGSMICVFLHRIRSSFNFGVPFINCIRLQMHQFVRLCQNIKRPSHCINSKRLIDLCFNK